MKLYEKALIIAMAVLSLTAVVIHYNKGENITWPFIAFILTWSSSNWYNRGFRDGSKK
jgi:hypothetical protein